MSGSVAEERIRAKTEALLRERFPTARIIHELVLEQGGVRLDLAAVTADQLVVAEIKSERDQLKRLPDQVKAALRVAQEVWVVVAEKWVPQIELAQESTISLAQPVEIGKGRFQCTEPNPAYIEGLRLCHRYSEGEDGLIGARRHSAGALAGYPNWLWGHPGHPHDVPNPSAMLHMLWADELRNVLAAHRIAPKSARFPMMREAVELMTGREIRRAVCGQLLKRPFPRADEPVRAAA